MVSLVSPGLLADTQAGRVVVLAGAGVSAGPPTLLPSWGPLNVAIIRVLAERLEEALERPGWLVSVLAAVERQRGSNRFPPEYQAQIIEEACGLRYFRGLQALDIGLVNSGHDGIAALAHAGALRAVVTTNFDRLIERALEERGVPYEEVYDANGFASMASKLISGAIGALPVVKVHGSVIDERSMVDTLKQRKLGRSHHLSELTAALGAVHWLYLGFSAADLDGDPSYLGLCAAARRATGGTFVRYPGHVENSAGVSEVAEPNPPPLGPGARALLAAFASPTDTPVVQVAEVLVELAAGLHVPGPRAIASAPVNGRDLVEGRLGAWAAALEVPAAALALAGVLEAVGQAEAAVRVLDRLVRKEPQLRTSPDYPNVALHYGRLGAAWGRFINVPDMHGAQANASVETVQSLLRLQHGELGFAARSWAACAMLWLGWGQQTNGMATAMIISLRKGLWEDPRPRTEEEISDCWLAAAEIAVISGHGQLALTVRDSAELARVHARAVGDVVRAARVSAMELLVRAELGEEDLLAAAALYPEDLAEAVRVGDALTLGLRELALGRWLVGSARGSLVASAGVTAVAEQALAHLDIAVAHLRRQNMDPWVCLARLQAAKAVGDLWVGGEPKYRSEATIDAAQNVLNDARNGIERFPVLRSHLMETAGQLALLFGAEEAKGHFLEAITVAKACGLPWRVQFLERYLEHFD